MLIACLLVFAFYRITVFPHSSVGLSVIVVFHDYILTMAVWI